MILPLMIAASIAVGCRTERPMTEDYEKYTLAVPAASIRVVADNGDYYVVDFNKSGRIEKRQYFSADGRLNAKSVYKYREGKLEELQSYDSDGQMGTRQIYVYEGDTLRETSVRGMNNQALYKWTYEAGDDDTTIITYSQEDEPVFYAVRHIDGLECYDETFNSEDGSLMGVARNVFFDRIDGKVALVDADEMHLSIDYDKNGLPVHCQNTLVTSEGNIAWDPSLDENTERWYRYDFDSRGNWIERKEYCHPDDVEVATLHRIIRY